jgi:hypothetical protein
MALPSVGSNCAGKHSHTQPVPFSTCVDFMKCQVNFWLSHNDQETLKSYLLQGHQALRVLAHEVQVDLIND